MSRDAIYMYTLSKLVPLIFVQLLQCTVMHIHPVHPSILGAWRMICLSDINRFLQASMITKADVSISKSKMDRFCAWAFEQAVASKHGDLMRLLAGAKSAANQIEYVKKYGNGLPVDEEEGFPATLASNEEEIIVTPLKREEFDEEGEADEEPEEITLGDIMSAPVGTQRITDEQVLARGLNDEAETSGDSANH